MLSAWTQATLAAEGTARELTPQATQAGQGEGEHFNFNFRHKLFSKEQPEEKTQEQTQISEGPIPLPCSPHDVLLSEPG